MYNRNCIKFNYNNRHMLYVILAFVLIFIFTLTIAYSVLSVTLNISGSSEIVASNWDIHLENVKVRNGSVIDGQVSIVGPYSATFTSTLTNPGDFYEFSVDVVNSGSIDAMVDAIEKTNSLTAEQSKYLNYVVEYQNGDAINSKQLVASGSYVRLKVRVEYRRDIEVADLPSTASSVNLGFTIVYLQSDNSSYGIVDNGIYQPYAVGNEVCFNTECFNLIDSDDTTVTLLAKYNLYVGGSYDTSWTAYDESATGKQDSSMRGYHSATGRPFKGTTPFATEEYHGSDYSSYVGSIAELYVNNYKNFLIGDNINVLDARLLCLDDLYALGCSATDKNCINAPIFLFNTSFWLSNFSGIEYVQAFRSDGKFSPARYSGLTNNGIRPVIKVTKEDFLKFYK